MPDPKRLRVHRIVVAHDAAQRCRKLLGGSGSLLILPSLVGPDHCELTSTFFGRDTLCDSFAESLLEEVGYSKKTLPFSIGDVDPSQGFVHVFDDMGLDVVMRELDTTQDFIEYLTNREEFLRSGRLLTAAGEEDLLAHYLEELNGFSCRTFALPEDPLCKIAIPEGEWLALENSSDWHKRKTANEPSYFWDRLIETFNTAILNGTSPAYPDADFEMQELAVRALGRETRFRRRILVGALQEFISNSKNRAIESRLIIPQSASQPHYVFLLVGREDNISDDDYLKKRRNIAFAYLIEAKRKYDANEVVVIALRPMNMWKLSNEEILYRGPAPLDSQELDAVRSFVSDQQILGKVEQSHRTIHEYPESLHQD